MTTTLTRLRLSLEDILYATDFSDSARAALPYAVSLAQHFGSTLHLVDVVTPLTNVIPFEPFPVDTRGTAEEQMRKLLRSDALRHVVHDARLEEGNLWNVLHELILGGDFDLIVVGTHGRSGVRKLALGSVAEEIIRSAHGLVLTVGPNVHVNAPADVRLQSILCASDLSPESDRAVDYSVLFAEDSGGSLTLVHSLSVPGDLACLNAVKWATCQKLKRQLPTETSLRTPPSLVVDFGTASRVIVCAAQKQRADLIVMGVKHTEHPWLSSHATWLTIHQVLVQASCPVLTVRV